MRSGGLIAHQVSILEIGECSVCVLLSSRHLGWYCYLLVWLCSLCDVWSAVELRSGIVICSLCNFSSAVEFLPAGCAFGKFG